MAFYRAVGELPRKRHTQFHRPEGGLYAEELMGAEGFSSDSSLLYHRNLPTAITAAVAVDEPAQPTTPNRPLLPRHFRTHELGVGGDPVTGRRLLLANADVRVSSVAANAASGLYRNAIGDELIYVESGSARLETVFGALQVGSGDYVVIPTSTTHRWLPPRAGGVAAAGDRGRRPRRAASALPVVARAVPRAQPVLRA